MNNDQPMSVLGRVRLDALRECRANCAETDGMEIDEAHYRGVCEGRIEGRRSNSRWWLFGLLCGIAVSLIWWGLS